MLCWLFLSKALVQSFSLGNNFYQLSNNKIKIGSTIAFHLIWNGRTEEAIPEIKIPHLKTWNIVIKYFVFFINLLGFTHQQKTKKKMCLSNFFARKKKCFQIPFKLNILWLSLQNIFCFKRKTKRKLKQQSYHATLFWFEKNRKTLSLRVAKIFSTIINLVFILKYHNIINQ